MKNELIHKADVINSHLSDLFEQQRLLRKDICESIYDMIQDMTDGKGMMEFDKEDYPVIAYDGGNHVEYASTMSATVSEIRTVVESDGRKSFTLFLPGHCDRYDEYSVLFDDLCTIFDYVNGMYWSFCNKTN